MIAAMNFWGACMQTFHITNLECPSYADTLEHKLRSIKGVRFVQISFATNTLTIDCDDIESIKQAISSLEPKVKITKKPLNC